MPSNDNRLLPGVQLSSDSTTSVSSTCVSAGHFMMTPTPDDIPLSSSGSGVTEGNTSVIIH